MKTKPTYDKTKWRRLRSNEIIREGDKHCCKEHVEKFTPSATYLGLPEGCIESGRWDHIKGAKVSEHNWAAFFRERKVKQ